jgi:predicted dehydrogenase
LLQTAPALKAVYSKSENSAKQVATAAVDALHLNAPPDVYHDGDTSANLDALLARDDISSVIVVLPITLQPSVILKAWKAGRALSIPRFLILFAQDNIGKHVLSEKPVAKDVASGLELIDTYNKEFKPKGIIWRIAENFEAEPGYRAAAKAIQDGKIGKISTFTASVNNYIDQTSKWYNTPWRTIPEYQGGFLLDGGVHTVAALRLILPERMTALSGFASLNKDYLAPHDSITATVKAGNHSHGIFYMTFAHPTQKKPNADGFSFIGDKGFITINAVPANGKQVLKVTVHTADGESSEEYPFEGVKVELDSFFAKLRGEDTLEIGDPLEALRDVAFIQAALVSDGNSIELEKLVKVSQEHFALNPPANEQCRHNSSCKCCVTITKHQYKTGPRLPFLYQPQSCTDCQVDSAVGPPTSSRSDSPPAGGI